MKRLLTLLTLLTLLLLCFLGLFVSESKAQSRWRSFFPRLFGQVSVNYRTRCILVGGMVQTQADPSTLLLLQRIADQQAQMLSNQQAMQLLAAQNNARQPAATDPQLIVLLTALEAKQDRIVDAINNGKIEQATNIALMREMISGQQQIIAAIRDVKTTPAVHPNPPIVVTPPPSGPIIVNPPANPGTLPGAGNPLNPLPSAGGPLQTVPGPGGTLNVLPPAGGSLQALPGPGGSIMVIPGGTRPPEGTKPPGGAVAPLPGAGNPLPGIEASGPIVYKTINDKRR